MKDLEKNNLDNNNLDNNNLDKNSADKNDMKKGSSASKWTAKRIIALGGIVLLVAMYIAMLVLSFVFPKDAMGMFVIAVSATVAVPILIWILIWMTGLFTGHHTIASLDAMSSNQDHDMYGNVVRKRADGQIQTVILDIGNVLVDFSWRDMLRGKGYSEEMVERLGDATVRTKEWTEYDLGNMSPEEVRRLFVKNAPELGEDIEKAFADLKGLVRLRPTTHAFIEALKRSHHQVLVLSNFSKQCLNENREDMSFLEDVDGGILSYREHLVKPDPEIYKLLLERYDLKPEECVFVDDTESNIEAARKLGIHGIVCKDFDQVVADLQKLGVK